VNRQFDLRRGSDRPPTLVHNSFSQATAKRRMGQPDAALFFGGVRMAVQGKRREGVSDGAAYLRARIVEIRKLVREARGESSKAALRQLLRVYERRLERCMDLQRHGEGGEP
jgi:hypothetical protein